MIPYETKLGIRLIFNDCLHVNANCFHCTEVCYRLYETFNVALFTPCGVCICDSKS